MSEEDEEDEEREGPRMAEFFDSGANGPATFHVVRVFGTAARLACGGKRDPKKLRARRFASCIESEIRCRRIGCQNDFAKADREQKEKEARLNPPAKAPVNPNEVVQTMSLPEMCLRIYQSVTGSSDPMDSEEIQNSDEPMFVLLGRDKHASELVRAWASKREAAGEDPAKVREARDCANAMVEWRAAFKVMNSGNLESKVNKGETE